MTVLTKRLASLKLMEIMAILEWKSSEIKTNFNTTMIPAQSLTIKILFKKSGIMPTVESIKIKTKKNSRFCPTSISPFRPRKTPDFSEHVSAWTAKTPSCRPSSKTQTYKNCKKEQTHAHPSWTLNFKTQSTTFCPDQSTHTCTNQCKMQKTRSKESWEKVLNSNYDKNKDTCFTEAFHSTWQRNGLRP
jgi:hypothetical protein